MNERIWELASKSGFDVSADGKFGNYSQMYKIEKFSELIVRECANIDFRFKVGMTTDQESDTGRVILEHFDLK